MSTQALEVEGLVVVRRVKVNRQLTPQQALDATGRVQYTNKAVVNGMPLGNGEEVDLYYFKPSPDAYRNGLISVDEVDRQFKARHLKPDPKAQLEDNAQNPAFADSTPNGSQWRDADGNACYVACSGWIGLRRVSVRSDDRGWSDWWSFAGVPE